MKPVTLIQTAAILLSAHCVSSAQQMVEFLGNCDASGAVLAGRNLLVIDDEDSPKTMLRLFDPAGGPPNRTVELPTASLQFDLKEPELDLEAITRIGRVYWAIGSHSRSKAMQPRWSRQNLIAFRLTASEAVMIADMSSLIPALGILLRATDKDLKNIDPEKEPKEGGLSIEGLTAAPGGALMIGLRAPLATGNLAIVAELTNPMEAARSNRASHHLKRAFLLSLEGNGIRDIVYDAAKKRYLILSGPVGPGGPFKVWQWNGGEGKPVIVRDLTQLIPPDTSAETLLPSPSGGDWWVLLDEGTRPATSENTECKDAKPEQKSFRGFRIEL